MFQLSILGHTKQGICLQNAFRATPLFHETLISIFRNLQLTFMAAETSTLLPDRRQGMAYSTKHNLDAIGSLTPNHGACRSDVLASWLFPLYLQLILVHPTPRLAVLNLLFK